MSFDYFEDFRVHLERRPTEVAFQSIGQQGRETFTYQQVGREISRLACYLHRQGIGAGNTVGILMENHPRWGIAFLAGMSAGATLVPFDILHDNETLAGLIQHSECDFLISSQKFLGNLQEIQRLLPRPLPALIKGDSSGEYPGWEEALAAFPEAEIPAPLVPADPEDPLVIIYTSGTTGDPKGVVLSRRNIFTNVLALERMIELRADDHILSVLPLYHVLALMANFIIPLHAGVRVTYLDVLDAQRILRTFREEGISLFVCVPQFYYLVHRRIFQEVARQSWPKRLAFRQLLALSRFCNTRLGFNPGRFFFPAIHRPFGSRLRFFGVGGARFDQQTAESFRDLGFTFLQAYGMTETAAVAALTPLGSSKLGSVGQPLPHVQIRIDEPDEAGVGEVLIRGENIMKGYLKNPQATEAALRDGWLHSGDLGYVSPDGFLHITGRKKEVIVLSSGKNIYPEEIEFFYQSHCPAIKEMCVLGVPDPSSGEREEKLHAVVVPDFDYLKSQQIANAYDMIRYLLEGLSEKLPPHKRVRSFEIRVDPLPRTTTRKIKRFEVQEEIARRAGEAPPPRFQEETPAGNAVEAKIFELIRQAKPGNPIHREMNLELDLGFDSLGRVEFLSNVQEALGVEISDEVAVRLLTVQDLIQAVQDRLAAEPQETATARRSWREILAEPLQEEEQRVVQERLSRRPVVELLFFLFARTVYGLSRVFFRLRAEGLEHLPQGYPFMVCPNHLSFLDALLVGAPFPRRIVARLFSLGFASYFDSGILGFLGKLVKVVPVDADRHLRQALRLGAEGLRRGLILMVFPEGERSIDGTLKPFKRGPAILAVEMGVPVIPTAVVGTYEAWPRGSNRIRPHPVTIRYGKPIRPEPGETAEVFNDRLFREVQALLEAGPGGAA